MSSTLRTINHNAFVHVVSHELASRGVRYDTVSATELRSGTLISGLHARHRGAFVQIAA